MQHAHLKEVRNDGISVFHVLYRFPHSHFEVVLEENGVVAAVDGAMQTASFRRNPELAFFHIHPILVRPAVNLAMEEDVRAFRFL